MSSSMSLPTSQAKTLTQRLPDAILETILSRLPALSLTAALLFSNTAANEIIFGCSGNHRAAISLDKVEQWSLASLLLQCDFKIALHY